MKKYKWKTVENIKFFTNGIQCTDIEIPNNNIKKVFFKYPQISISRDIKKAFPNIVELIIGYEVSNISIPNKMFPNVKKVTSMSDYFISGKYLIGRGNGCNRNDTYLLNVFKQSEDDAIDFSLFSQIESYAFEGCKAKKIINAYENKSLIVKYHAFFDSGFLSLPFVNGLKRIGPIVFDCDGDADEIVLPKEAIYCFPSKTAKCMRILNINNLAEVHVSPKKIVIEDFRQFRNDELYYRLSFDGLEEIESNISAYATVDGILYSGDIQTLIRCPKSKTGTIIIPNGVKRIGKGAFSNTKINKVILPNSLEKIEEYAFSECSNLKYVDFGHGLKIIGKRAFVNCAVEKIIFRSQIKIIGESAFWECNCLRELNFNEGLEEILDYAFYDCKNLSNINFPKSLKKIGKEAFIRRAVSNEANDMDIKIKSIPQNFLRSLVYSGKTKQMTCINIYIDKNDNSFSFTLPDAIISTDFKNINAALKHIDSDDAKQKLNTAYQLAQNLVHVYITAFRAYQKTRNNEAKSFLQSKSLDIANMLIDKRTEKDFADFVSLDFIKLDYDEKIVGKLQKNGWTAAIAYLLNNQQCQDKFQI